MTSTTLTVKEAAELLNVTQQYLRVAMQRNLLPIGMAIKTSSQWKYIIPKAKFTEVTGIPVD